MSRDRLYIEPKTVVVSNPGKNYGIPTTPLPLWSGEVRSFERRVRFGKEMPVPWWKEYKVRATDEGMAMQLIAVLAKRDGYAIGGVQNIRKSE